MIQLTEKAVNEIKRIVAADPKAPGAMLRVMVMGGGCSGMSYKLDLEAQAPASTDKVFEQDGVKLVVDSKSHLFVDGTVLDFSDGLNGKGFVFENPNAKRTCGCGNSFSA
jgi:iron-sulfur cluster assembly protein